jgi:uncharacterized protein affecting Mg2+/Co2+ transport
LIRTSTIIVNTLVFGAMEGRVARGLFRDVVRLLRGHESVRLVEPVVGPSLQNPRAYGFAEYVPDALIRDLMTCRSFVCESLEGQRFSPEHGLPVSASGDVSAGQLLAAVRHEFKSGGHSGEALDRGFACVRFLREMLERQTHRSVAVTHGVLVEMTTQWVMGTRWQFLYRVRIRNQRSDAVSLRSRWIHIDYGRRVAAGALPIPEDVHYGQTGAPKGSTGVVGQRPTLEPGTTFEYFSGTGHVASPEGTIHGSYSLIGDDHHSFDALIAPVVFEQPDDLRAIKHWQKRGDLHSPVHYD